MHLVAKSCGYTPSGKSTIYHKVHAVHSSDTERTPFTSRLAATVHIHTMRQSDEHKATMSNTPLATASDLKSEHFAELNIELYDAYVELKVHGYNSSIALGKVFGTDYINQQTNVSVQALESNPYYIRRFKDRLASIKIQDLWNTKTSLNELLQLVRSPFASDHTRLNAQKELNIMVGIIVIDENGKTKAGRSLDDFYKDREKHKRPPAPPEQETPES